jgi:hypothetical protein
MSLGASGAMADGGTHTAEQEAPKKVRSTKVHKAHKFHADHKVAEAPPPEPPPPTPVPPPVVVEQAVVAPVNVEKDESGFYFGGGAGRFQLDFAALNFNGVGGRARVKDSQFGGYVDMGYNFNRTFAVEVRVGGVDDVVGIQEGGPLIGVIRSQPFEFLADSDAFYSAFLKANLPLGEVSNVYGLIGGTHYVVDLAGDVGPIRYREDFNDGDLSYGVGIEAKVGTWGMAGVEYVKYVEDNDGAVAIDLDGLAGRLQVRF